jgi:hypothetical protein
MVPSFATGVPFTLTSTNSNFAVAQVLCTEVVAVGRMEVVVVEVVVEVVDVLVVVKVREVMMVVVLAGELPGLEVVVVLEEVVVLFVFWA